MPLVDKSHLVLSTQTTERAARQQLHQQPLVDRLKALIWGQGLKKKEGLRGQRGQCLRTLRLHPFMLAHGQLEMAVAAQGHRGTDLSCHSSTRA